MAKAGVLKLHKKYNQSVLYIVVAAALAAGTYLLLQALAFAPVTAHFADLHASTYKRGEAVVFGITDASKNFIVISTSDPWQVTDTNHNVVYKPAAGNVETELLPQENRYWSWDQRDSHGQQVKPGVYFVTVRYEQNGHPGTVQLQLTIR